MLTVKVNTEIWTRKHSY